MHLPYHYTTILRPVHSSYITIEIWGSHSGAANEDSSFLGCWLQHLDWYRGTMRRGVTAQNTCNYVKLTPLGPS
jgi:hypothetical protein